MKLQSISKKIMNENHMVNTIVAILLILAFILTVNRILTYKYSNEVVVQSIELPKAPQVDRFEIIKEAHCLAENIYHEARNQSKRGQLAVASVTMNRVHDSEFPNDVCSVVYQRNKSGCQFSWLCKNRTVSFDNPIYKKTYKKSKKILLGEIKLDNLDNALFYHADYVKPRWTKHKEYVTKIETHIFYK
jgi:spore germination cell wall hydrolase CwlJ-like protein